MSSDKPPLPLPASPLPVASNQDEFARLSPEKQAALLYQWQEFWFHPGPAVSPSSPASRIVIPPAPSSPTEDDWKGPAPTEAELRSMHENEWKKY